MNILYLVNGKGQSSFYFCRAFFFFFDKCPLSSLDTSTLSHLGFLRFACKLPQVIYSFLSLSILVTSTDNLNIFPATCRSPPCLFFSATLNHTRSLILPPYTFPFIIADTLITNLTWHFALPISTCCTHVSYPLPTLPAALDRWR